jgi:hypothetical protein
MPVSGCRTSSPVGLCGSARPYRGQRGARRARRGRQPLRPRSRCARARHHRAYQAARPRWAMTSPTPWPCARLPAPSPQLEKSRLVAKLRAAREAHGKPGGRKGLCRGHARDRGARQGAARLGPPIPQDQCRPGRARPRHLKSQAARRLGRPEDAEMTTPRGTLVGARAAGARGAAGAIMNPRRRTQVNAVLLNMECRYDAVAMPWNEGC